MRRLAAFLLVLLAPLAVACGSNDPDTPATPSTTTAAPGTSTSAPSATSLSVPNSPRDAPGASDQGSQDSQG
jgi:hypothetical protein